MTARPDPIELLQALVGIPSVNPSGDPGTTEVGEAACAQFIAQRLEDLGARVELREILPGRPNVLGCFPADRPGKPKLLLCPHTDTVSVTGMSIDPFQAERREGRVYGRGATDTKGTITAMLCALWELRAELPRLQHEIWFAGLMGEEAGNEGAGAVAADFKGADFALVGEPTQCEIVNTHKGVTWLLVTTHGHSVHSATPELGVNAIYKMADVIRCVRDRLVPAFAQYTDPVLGAPTASAGVVRGGSKVNIVPDACALELDLRTIPAQQDRTKLVDEVTALLRQAVADVKVELIRAHQPLYTAPTHPCVQALMAAGGHCVGAPWFCDGSLLASAGGIPSVAAGPGNIAQAHTVDEWLAEDDLARGVQFYTDFLRRV
jgi:acetylornithine deacetylase/succinyl-diaminopimelate desuccinylase-like protein